MQSNFIVENSKARSTWQFPEQKVIFKYLWLNIGEVEMRNDSEIHYREIRFNMIKPRFMNLVFSNLDNPVIFTEWVLVYWEAKKKFGRWIKNKK
jgi:hypothetical protein